MNVADDLWSHVDQSAGPNGCWPFMRTRIYRKKSRRGTFIGGYGQVRCNGRKVGAHRLAWELHNGRTIPVGLVVRHSCDNPPCCNPAHLSLGTRKDDVRDRVERGHQWRPVAEDCCRGEQHYRARLTEQDVIDMRDAYRAGDSSPVIAARYGMAIGGVREALIGHTWSHVPGPVVMRTSTAHKPWQHRMGQE